MFDLSFFEMIVIGVVALVVIGPEKLPVVARTAGRMMARVQGFITQVKDEVNQDARFDELQSLQGEFTAGVNKVKSSVNSEFSDLSEMVSSTAESVSESTSEVAAEKTPSVKRKPRERVSKSTHKKKSSRTKSSLRKPSAK